MWNYVRSWEKKKNFHERLKSRILILEDENKSLNAIEEREIEKEIENYNELKSRVLFLEEENINLKKESKERELEKYRDSVLGSLQKENEKLKNFVETVGIRYKLMQYENNEFKNRYQQNLDDLKEREKENLILKNMCNQQNLSEDARERGQLLGELEYFKRKTQEYRNQRNNLILLINKKNGIPSST